MLFRNYNCCLFISHGLIIQSIVRKGAHQSWSTLLRFFPYICFEITVVVCSSLMSWLAFHCHRGVLTNHGQLIYVFFHTGNIQFPKLTVHSSVRCFQIQKSLPWCCFETTVVVRSSLMAWLAFHCQRGCSPITVNSSTVFFHTLNAPSL